MKLLSLWTFFALTTVLVASKITAEGGQDMLERELSEIVDEGDQYIERELSEIAAEDYQDMLERELIEVADEGDQDVERELRFWQGGGARGFGGGLGGRGHRGGGGGHRGGGHRGGGGHDGVRGSGRGNVTLTCDSNCISCDIPYGRGLVIPDGGYRLCRQSRRDETKWYNLCLAKTEPMVGFVTDKWGCCEENGTDKTCPAACSGCECTETIGHFSSITVPGSTMNITRTHWYGGTTSFTKCVSNSFTVQKQLEGATCCP